MANENRLIDANAFRNSIKGWKLGKIPKGELLWDLDRQPTVDAVEVVHGRWDGNGNCSACGKNIYKDMDADMWSCYEPPYCPNCGADMRERKDNG
jgi:hypothetical protein